MMIMGYLRTVFFKLKFQKFGSKSLSVQVSLAGVLRNVNKKTVHQLVFLTHTSSPFHTGHRRCCDVFLRKLMGSKSPNGRLKNPGMQIADTFFFFFWGGSMPEFWSAMAILSNSKQCNSEGLNNSVLIWQASYFLSHLTVSWLQVEAAGFLYVLKVKQTGGLSVPNLDHPAFSWL